jgi:hypothetical protein
MRWKMPPRNYRNYYPDRGRYSRSPYSRSRRYGRKPPAKRTPTKTYARPRSYYDRYGRRPQPAKPAPKKKYPKKKGGPRTRGRRRVTLKKGDSVTSLAKKHGISEGQLVAANAGLYNYRAGAVVNIPRERRDWEEAVEPIAEFFRDVYGEGLLGALQERLGRRPPITNIYGTTRIETMAEGQLPPGYGGRPEDYGGTYTGSGGEYINPAYERTEDAAYDYEHIYLMGLNWTGRAIQEYGAFPNILDNRLVRDLQALNVIGDPEALGYQKVGDFWILYEPIDVPPEAQEMGYGDYYPSGYGYGGGGGWGGGGGRGGGGRGGGGELPALPNYSSLPHRAFGTGQFARSQAGRTYIPVDGALIYWRI